MRLKMYPKRTTPRQAMGYHRQDKNIKTISKQASGHRPAGQSIFISTLTAVVLLIPAILCAQHAVPPGIDPGTLLEQEKKLAPQQLKPAVPPIIKPEMTAPGKEGPSALRVQVKEFRVDGVITAFSKEELLALVKDLVNKELSMQDLQQASDRITNHYRSNGYFLARAVLQKQDITEGIITVTVIEGVLEDDPKDGGVKINSTKLRIDEDVIRKTVRSAAPPGKALKQEGLERGILLLNDMPGLSSSANLEAGTTPGATRLVVDAKEGSLFNSYVMFDNYGNRYTGSSRVTAGVNLNDLTGRGDQLALSGNKTVDGDYDFISGVYNRPVGYSGLNLGVSYNRLEYKVGEELKDVGSKGSADNVTLSARYPLIKNRLSTLLFIASYDWKRLENFALDTKISDKRVNAFNLGFLYYGTDGFAGGGFKQLGITLTAGVLDLGNLEANLDADRATAKTNGSYGKMSFNASRLQKISETINFFISSSGQISGKNLDTSEKFILGGPTGVRAYPSSEGIGDSGIKTSAEVRWSALSNTPIGDLQLTSFYDLGVIRQYDNVWTNAGLTTPNVYRLQSAGFGMSIGKQGRYDARLTYAFKIGDNPGANMQGNDSDGKSYHERIWFQVSAMF